MAARLLDRHFVVLKACRNVALPVLECIDFVSDVGGVDQAPQYVVVEVAEAEAMPRRNSNRPLIASTGPLDTP